MRILIATGLYPPESGGPATYTKLLEDKLPALGFEVAVLPFRLVRQLPPGIRHLAYFWKCYRMASQADIVYAQDAVSVGLPAALATLVAGKKFVVRVPGDWAWEQGRQRWRVEDELDEFQTRRYGLRIEIARAVQCFVVRRARMVVVPSEYLKKVVSGWGVLPVVIYNGIELPVPAEPPANRPGGFLVVSIGRRVPWKGFEALERVVASEEGWRLIIAEDLPRAQALGWVQVADAFVLNSTYEGLSHTLLEVMSIGTPIVATRAGGNPELIQEGKEGLLISPGDEGALRAALKKIQTDPLTARARAEAAKTRAGKFSIDQTLSRLSAALQALL